MCDLVQKWKNVISACLDEEQEEQENCFYVET